MNHQLHPYTFKRTDRIQKRSEFIRLSKTGRKIQDNYFIALFDAGGANSKRLGITVTKKVGGAATRNRIKRLVREYFRINKNNIKGHFDINVIAKKSAATLTSNQIFSSLQGIFSTLSRKLNV